MRLPGIDTKKRARRLAMLFALPVLTTAIVAPVVAHITDAKGSSAALDKVTLDAIELAASRPVELDVDPTTTTTSTTVAPATTTTTMAPTTTTTTEAPSSIGNKGDFALPPGAKLPTGAECAKKVKKTKENRPANKAANNAKVAKPVLPPNWGSDPDAIRMMNRADGAFSGTTDEIIQWAACKWGFEAETVRAQVAVESSWRQGATAAPTDDPAKCAPGLTAPCQRAFGLLQIRTDYNPGAYPAVAQSTAYNLDYGLAMKRACYEGDLWFGAQTRGDAWGCVGVHYSGKWLDPDGLAYIDKVKANYDAKPWKKY